MNGLRSRAALTATVLWLVVASAAAAQNLTVDGKGDLGFYDTGPLRIREQFLLSTGYLAFDPSSAELLDAGEWQVDLVESVTNTWVRSQAVDRILDARAERRSLTLAELRAAEPDNGDGGVFQADGEVFRASLSVRRGFGDDLQLGLTISYLHLGGGIGDSTIEGFHDVLGLTQSGRLGVPRNDYSVYLRAGDSEVFHRGDPSGELGDLTAHLKWRIPGTGERWRLALEGIVKLPTGDEELLHSSGSTDYGAQLLAARYYEHGLLHLSIGALWLGDHQLFGVDGQLNVASLLAYEHATGRRSSVVLQLTATETPFDDLDIDQLSRVAYLVDLGFKWAFDRRTVLFLALSENFVNFGNSADVGLHLGLTQTW